MENVTLLFPSAIFPLPSTRPPPGPTFCETEPGGRDGIGVGERVAVFVEVGTGPVAVTLGMGV